MFEFSNSSRDWNAPFRDWLATSTPSNTLFRVEATNGDPCYLSHYEFPILRETPGMWWIAHWSCAKGKLKGVLKGDGKRFAHERKEWALYSFICRNKWHQSGLRTSLSYAEETGKLAQAFYQSHMAMVPRTPSI